MSNLVRNRRVALTWWRNLSDETKEELAKKYYYCEPHMVAAQEIEKIYRNHFYNR